MGGDFAQRRQFVSDAADGMAVDAVLDILKAAAETSHATISHSLVRLLSKLAVHAEVGAAPVRPQADAALREQVQQLLAGWTLSDPNPGAYGAALQRMAQAAPAGAPPRTDHHLTEPDRLVAMALEIGTMGPRLPAAVDRVVAEGRLAQLLDALEGGVAGGQTAAEAPGWSRRGARRRPARSGPAHVAPRAEPRGRAAGFAGRRGAPVGESCHGSYARGRPACARRTVLGLHQGAGCARDVAADDGGRSDPVQAGEAGWQVPRAPRRAGGARDRLARRPTGARAPQHRGLVH